MVENIYFDCKTQIKESDTHTCIKEKMKDKDEQRGCPHHGNPKNSYFKRTSKILRCSP